MNSLKLDEIYTFKLTTGEEITAKVINKFEGEIEISHPIAMVISPQGLQMMPGLFSANQEKTVLLNKSSWAMIAETREDVRNSYIEATTGIAPVRKQIITG